MRLIFTEVDARLAKRQLPNFRASYIIDLSEYMLEAEYVRSGHVSNSAEYLVNKEVEKKLKQAANNKRAGQVVYFHFDINSILLDNVRGFYEDMDVDVEICLFDPTDELSPIHEVFDLVVAPSDK